MRYDLLDKSSILPATLKSTCKLSRDSGAFYLKHKKEALLLKE